MSGYPRLTCTTALERFQDCLDEDLSAFARPVSVNIHLAACPACRRRAAGLERIHKAAQRLAREAPVRRPLVRRLALAAMLFFGLNLPARLLPPSPVPAVPTCQLEEDGDRLLLQTLHERGEVFGAWEA